MSRWDKTSGVLTVLLPIEIHIKNLMRQTVRIHRSFTLQLREVKREISEERRHVRQERVEAAQRAVTIERIREGYVPFRKFLRKLRQARGMSVAGAARVVGVARSYLTSIESGKFPPPMLDRLGRFADAYGASETRMQILGFIDRAPLAIRRSLKNLLFPEDSSGATGLSYSEERARAEDATTAPRRTMRFGRLMRRLRLARGLTQPQVGRLAKVDSGFVCVLETKRNRIGSPKLIRRLATLYGVERKALLILAYSERAPDEIHRWVLGRLAPLFPRLRGGRATHGTIPEGSQVAKSGS